MLKHLLTTAFTLLALNDLHGQTFTAPGGSIPDGGPQVAFPVVVSGLSQTTLDQSFGLETVCFNIEHTWDSDLVIKLQAPDGTVVDLAYNVGGSGDDFTNTCLNPFASTSITSGNAPFNGTFKPIGPLGNMNNGQNGNGTWYLLVQDVVGSDDGDVIDFSLTFGNDPDTPYNFGSTNLPLVIINTGNNVIQDEPKVMARMGIIYNGIGAPNSPTDIWNAYDNWCGIEYRGSSSGNFPQRSYGVETCDTFGTELTAPILAMPPEEDWALIATYNDKTLMRNALTYNLCNEMGYYAPRTRFCELILNDQYQGIYLLAEKIKRDQYRVNIANLQPQDISGDQVTGGYILKIDKFTGSNNGSWQSPHPPLDGNGTQDIVFQYEYPKAADLQPEQDDYIKGYIDSFENALLSPDFADTNIGYRHFADMNSFIDNFIINEVSRNVDGYRLSYYFYKDKASNGGKLRSGPAWDYNLAWWNADYCNGYADTGWAYRFGADCDWDNFQVPFWWGRMMEDTNFTNALKCRWEDLRGNILSNQHIFAYIDSNAAYLEQAQQRHFGQWPVMGIYTWPNPSPIGQTYAEEITHMKDWIAQRMIWLDAHMPGTCYPDPATTQSIALQNSIQVYPNPFMDNVKLDLDAQAGGDVLIEIYSSVGQLVYTNNYKYNAGKNTYRIQVDDQLASGVYFLKASSKDHSYSQRIIKQVK